MTKKKTNENSVKTEKKLNRKGEGTNFFKKGYDERRNYKGRTKGTRNWQTDFEYAIKDAAKKLNIKPSEIRTEFLSKGIRSGLRGNFNFWKEITEREYGKVSQPIEGEIDVSGAKELGEKLQEILDDDETKKSNKKNS